MTVPVQDTWRQYSEDGVTTDFALPFQFASIAEVKARRILADETVVSLAAGVDFTVTGGATVDSGLLIVTAPAAVGVTLQIWRDTPASQQDEIGDVDRYPADQQEAALDKLTRITQDLDAQLGRALLVPFGEEGIELAAAVISALGDPGIALALTDLQAALDAQGRGYATALEALGKGKFVNIEGAQMRLASATDPDLFANAFVPAAVALGTTGAAVGFGMCPLPDIADPAAEVWLSDTEPGGYMTTPPTAEGYIVQPLGPAIPGQGILFSPQARTILS